MNRFERVASQDLRIRPQPEIPDNLKGAILILEGQMYEDIRELDERMPSSLAPISEQLAYGLAYSRVRADSEVIALLHLASEEEFGLGEIIIKKRPDNYRDPRQRPIPPLPEDIDEALIVLESQLLADALYLAVNKPAVNEPLSSVVAFALAEARVRADNEVIEVLRRVQQPLAA